MANKCLSKVLEYAKETGQKFDRRTMEGYAERFERMFDNNPEMSRAEIFAALDGIIEQDAVKRAEAGRAARLLNLKSVAEGINFLNDNRFGTDIVDNAHALLTGKSDKVVFGGNRGIRTVENGLAGRLLNKLFLAVEKDVDLLRRSGLDRELILEMGNVESGSPAAKRVAKAYNSIMNEVFDLKKSVNPFLEKISDYFIRQSHSREKISKVTFEQWAQVIEDTHGKKSFPDLSSDEKLMRLRGIYDAIINDDYGASFIKEPGNKMYAMARERVLIPNDADSFYRYFKTFGEGNVFETMQQTIRKGARDVAVMERLGATPKENFDKIIRTAMNKADPALRKKYAKNEKLLKAELETILGFSNAPAKTIAAKATKFILASEAVAKLSGVYLSLVDDIGRAAAMVEYTTGENPISTIGELVHNYARAFISKEHSAEAGKYVWLFTEGMHGSLINELASPDVAPGIMGRMAKVMSKLNFMERHQRAASTSIGIVISSMLADNVTRPFDKLSPFLRNTLTRAGISAEHWKVLAKGVEDLGPQSRQFVGKLLTPEGIDAIPDADFAAIISKKTGKPATPADIFRERSSLSNSVGALINDVAEAGSSTAGVAEMAKLYRGLDINDPLGMALRLIFQFKTAMMKNYNTTRRIYYSGADPMKGNYAGLAKVVGYGVVLYAMKKWAQSAMNGKTPEDPSTPGFVTQALVSSVGGSPFMDTLVHVGQLDYNKMLSKGQFATALLGPTANDALDIFELARRTGAYVGGNRQVKGEDIVNQLGRIASQSPLGALLKLPYTKSLMDYHIFNEIRSIGNPGYLRHVREQMKESGGPLTEAGLWPEQEYFMLDPRNK